MMNPVMMARLDKGPDTFILWQNGHYDYELTAGVQVSGKYKKIKSLKMSFDDVKKELNKEGYKPTAVRKDHKNHGYSVCVEYDGVPDDKILFWAKTKEECASFIKHNQSKIKKQYKLRKSDNLGIMDMEAKRMISFVIESVYNPSECDTITPSETKSSLFKGMIMAEAKLSVTDIPSGAEIFIIRDGGNVTTQFNAKVVEIDEDQGDLTVQYTGIESVEVDGVTMLCSKSSIMHGGAKDVKYTYNEIKRVSKVGAKYQVELSVR